MNLSAISRDFDRDGVEVLPQLLSKATVCQLLDNVTTKHVENLVRSGRMPPPVYLGRSPRWKRAELLNWINDGCPVLDHDKLKVWDAEQALRRNETERLNSNRRPLRRKTVRRR